MATRDEIKAILENAISRGESMEKAKQSLVNAGYNQEDISAAGSGISMGVTDSIPTPAIPSPSTQTPHQKAEQMQQPQEQTPDKGKPKFPWKILILIIVLVILLSVLGFLIFF
jgi:cobalamin biosynthesis Mg chelatase CobN